MVVVVVVVGGVVVGGTVVGGTVVGGVVVGGTVVGGAIIGGTVVVVVVVGGVVDRFTAKVSPTVSTIFCPPSSGPGDCHVAPGPSMLDAVAPVGQAANPVASVTTLMPSVVPSAKWTVSPWMGPLLPVRTTPVCAPFSTSVHGPAFAVDSTARS